MPSSAVSAARALSPLAVAAGLATLAELAARAGLLPIGLPAPSRVVASLVVDHAVYAYHLTATVETAAAGYALACLLAGLAGAFVHFVRRAEPALVTAAAIVNSVPIIALAPVLIVWLGVSETTRIVLAGLLSFFPLLVGTVRGLAAVPKGTDELFHLLAAGPVQRFRMLAVPSALPSVFLGLKTAAPLAVLGALVGEWTGGEAGLGVLMTNAMFNLQIDQLWGAVALACLLSSSAYGVLALAERRLVAPGLVLAEAA